MYAAAGVCVSGVKGVLLVEGWKTPLYFGDNLPILRALRAVPPVAGTTRTRCAMASAAVFS